MSVNLGEFALAAEEAGLGRRSASWTQLSVDAGVEQNPDQCCCEYLRLVAP